MYCFFVFMIFVLTEFKLLSAQGFHGCGFKRLNTCTTSPAFRFMGSKVFQQMDKNWYPELLLERGLRGLPSATTTGRFMESNQFLCSLGLLLLNSSSSLRFGPINSSGQVLAATAPGS